MELIVACLGLSVGWESVVASLVASPCVFAVVAPHC